MQKTIRLNIYAMIAAFVVFSIQGKTLVYALDIESYYIQNGCRVESIRGNDGSGFYFYYTTDGRFDRKETFDGYEVQYFYYNAQGNIDRIEIDAEHSEDNFVIHFIYDSDGRLIREEYYYDETDLTYYELFYYDNSGKRIKAEIVDAKTDQCVEVVYYYYDSAGKLDRWELDSGNNGNIEDIGIYHYDNSGKLTKIDYPILNEFAILTWNCKDEWIPDDNSGGEINGEEENDVINGENAEEELVEDKPKSGSSSSSGCFIRTL